MRRAARPSRSAGPVSVDGVRVGHATAPGGRTGVTVARFDVAAPTVVRIAGGASATYDTGSLALDATFGRRWAIFLAGGSLFGLDAARGVRDTVLSAGGGHTVFGHDRRVAPVSGAALFDLPRDDRALPDYVRLGAAATGAAASSAVPLGAVGAGAGATVGKYLGRGHASAGGVGYATRPVNGRATVGALVAGNAGGGDLGPSTRRGPARARRGGPVPSARGPPRGAGT